MADAKTKELLPCPVCGNEERGQGGYLSCECPAPAPQPADVPHDVVRALEAERDQARQIVRDIHWMARRYADGRRSYAPGMFNDAVRKAYDAGWLKWANDEPRYATDGDFGLPDCALATPASPTSTEEALRAENARLREALAEIKDNTNADDPDSYRSDDREGCLDTVFATALSALSR